MEGRMKKNLKIIRVFAFIALVALLITLIATFKDLTVENILSYQPESLILAFFILIGFYCLKSVTVVVPPLTVLYISAGIMFQTPLAIAISYLGLTCEMTIGYWIGRRVGNAGYEKLIDRYKMLGRWLAPSNETFNTVCFFVRLIPGPLPLDIMSVLFGATKTVFYRYILFSLLGVSPGMLAWAIAGRSISTPLSKEFLIPFSIALAITFASFIGLQILLKKETRNANAHKKE